MMTSDAEIKEAFIARVKTLYRMDRGDRTYIKRQFKRWLDVYKIIKQVQCQRPKAEILDVGCGSGFFMLMLGERVTGIDVAENIEICKRRELSRVFATDIEKRFPFENASFDVVTLLEVLEHLRKPEFTLKEIFRVLKPEGVLVLSTPNSSMPTWRIRDFALRFRFVGKIYMNRDLGADEKQYSKNELKGMLVSMGFEIPRIFGSKILVPNDDLMVIAVKPAAQSG